ncbi:unnamed protein product, partial [Staurois parvus]
ELPFSVTHQCQSQCCQSVRVSATYQCASVPPISVIYECCLSVSISDACQCPSVPPTSASSSMPISATYQCPSVPITAASLARLSEGEKSLIYKIL